MSWGPGAPPGDGPAAQPEAGGRGCTSQEQFWFSPPTRTRPSTGPTWSSRWAAAPPWTLPRSCSSCEGGVHVCVCGGAGGQPPPVPGQQCPARAARLLGPKLACARCPSTPRYEVPDIKFEGLAMRFMDIRCAHARAGGGGTLSMLSVVPMLCCYQSAKHGPAALSLHRPSHPHPHPHPHPHSKRVYEVPEQEKKTLLVCVPTTSGTGSEARAGGGGAGPGSVGSAGCGRGLPGRPPQPSAPGERRRPPSRPPFLAHARRR